MDFVIHIKNEPAEQGYWVLSVDAVGERFLTTHADGSFRWVAMADCTLLRVMTPDNPRPVVMIQPQKGLAVPQLQVGNGHGR